MRNGGNDGAQKVALTTNEKIYASLLRRDSKEKHVVVKNLIDANDALVRMVTTLKFELDESINVRDTMEIKEKALRRKVVELETLLKEKDKIISKLTKKKDGFLS